MPKKKSKITRSAKSGRFVKKTAAKRSPGTTVTETVNQQRGKLLSFPEAVDAVIQGHALRRREWVKGRQYDTVVLRTFGLGWRELDAVGYEATREDILAKDWEIA